MDAVDTETDYNVASNVVTVVVDVLAPTVTVNAPAANDGTAFDVTFTFSEDVSGFDPSDLRLMNATAADPWSSETARTYTASITTHDCGWECGYGNDPSASRCCTRWC